MKTRVFDITEIDDNSIEDIEKAAAVLRNGGLVAFPTETVYGLGADAMNPAAVEKIYEAKGRPSDNPLIVHIAQLDTLNTLVSEKTPEKLKEIEILADRFWPGPLTLVLKKNSSVPGITTGGLETVAVRMPDNPIALELIRRSGRPIAAPSANISGRPSPTRGLHVIRDLYGRVDVILKSGDCKIGIESTVLDMSGTVPAILRPGMVTPEQLSDALGKDVEISPAVLSQFKCNSETPPPSPGMKYTHYAPKAEMIVIEGNPEDVDKEIERLKSDSENLGKKVGVIQLGNKSYEDAAREFFARLRDLDDEGVDLILAGALSDKDSIGFAVMNRMLKAAGYRIIQV